MISTLRKILSKIVFIKKFADFYLIFQLFFPFSDTLTHNNKENYVFIINYKFCIIFEFLSLAINSHSLTFNSISEILGIQYI